MSQKIKKAVIPAAGFGTRMLPFTKAVPKELIPLADKPVIQYVVEEAVNSGIEEILLILSHGKDAILNHFAPAPELEARLHETGKHQLLEEINSIGQSVKISAVYQEELDGLGGAVKLAENFVGDDFFAVLLGDTVLTSSNGIPVTRQLIDACNCCGTSVAAVETVPVERISNYGIIGGTHLDANLLRVEAMVEKPSVKEAPGNYAVASRYILSPEIFPVLHRTPRGKGNEVQLTDALKKFIPDNKLHAWRINGSRYDLGSKAGFICANIEFALQDPELAQTVKNKLSSLLKN